jgi:glycosyltransferase involved in cell wall biosynthesis
MSDATTQPAPTVSWLLPVYNAQRYVAETMRSVLAQTFTDFEAIVIDDGSKDGSLAVLKPFAQADPRVRLISRPNTGYIPALNEGLQLARGKYLARIDADDLATPDRLAKQVAALEADPALVAVGCGGDLIDEHGDLIGDASCPLTHEEIEQHHLRGSSVIHHPGVTLRADAVRKVGGYDEALQPCEDFDLWLKLGEVGRVANLPDKLLKKRQLVSGAVVSGIDRHGRLVQQIMDAAYQRRGLPGRYEHQPLPVQDPVGFYRQWAWMALRSHSPRVVWRYTWKSLRARPLDRESWNLLFCAVRGR